MPHTTPWIRAMLGESKGHHLGPHVCNPNSYQEREEFTLEIGELPCFVFVNMLMKLKCCRRADDGRVLSKSLVLWNW